ncbi:hypothetical protein [Methanobrevibacter sp.]|uniref:hypothetical protein n=1 Tax=Methanobrevibacter sp. TaxID=66852 RepID=UPI0025ECB316|nr:hypothetical protein [Methanobrevibacter sp.]MBQ2832783.1 hypothetical protein [Methanobrevibacter sp.]
MNINKDNPIVYNPEILTKIKEMIKEGFEKLKSFVNIKSNELTTKIPNFEFYNELDQKFDEITFKLKELRLCDEYNYFLSISDYILYIVHQNSIDSTFGHCDLALELFDFFIEIWNEKIRLVKNFSEENIKKHEKLKLDFKKRYHIYRREFYWNIYEYSDDFDEKEMYEFAKSLKE